MSERNQCQGCQAVWPINKNGNHQVIGGYLGEVCGCSKPDPDGRTMRIDLKILDDRYGKSWPIPGYAKPGDAGIDLRALSVKTDACMERIGVGCFGDGLLLDPGDCALIGTGLAIHIADPNYAAFIYARSGLASKHGLAPANCVGVIDSGYQGEIKVALRNISDTPYTIEPGERIAQLLIMPVVQAQFRVVDSFEASERGEGGFGSTGSA